MARVVLAMSGGVDSSVAAHLLCAQGHEVIGLFMRHGEPIEAACAMGDDAKGVAGGLLPIVSNRLDHKQGCCTASDAADARRVADRLEIPFYALDFQEAFGQIIDYFVAEYTAARTPNPCVMCNTWLKFGKLLEVADGVGAEFVATGHYARLEPAADGSLALRRGLDGAKDQSYVLFGIDRQALPRLLFPIGGERKPRIRELARELGLRVADKRDSQEICFVSSGDHAEFVRRRRGEEDTSGEIVTTEGEVVGRHAGIEGFTIGQRKGLGLAFGERRFVVRIEADARRVIIGPRDALARRELTANRLNWLVDEPAGPLECQVQIRYNSPPVSAAVEPLPDGRLRVQLATPRDGVAPGQAVVVYGGDRVLGGGWIE
jgi:tRNA-specific 2-thiouridylase